MKLSDLGDGLGQHMLQEVAHVLQPLRQRVGVAIEVA
jgi:hypothetical protein